MSEPGWRADPSGNHEWRFWDGANWTERVGDAGEVSTSPYDPSELPPPPIAAPQQVSAPAESRSVSYRLCLLDRKGREISNAPFQSADMAMQHAQDNPALHLKHTMGSAFRKGLLHANIVPWQTAVILERDNATGEEQEYHRLEKKVGFFAG
jgi:hypothetical protein